MNYFNELSEYGNGRTVLNRYLYKGTLEEQPILSFCEKNGVDLQFIELICEAFQADSMPDAKRLSVFETSVILDYLEKTHAYYLGKLIPEIELTLFSIVQIIGIINPISIELIKRFDAYRTDLKEHIEDEEIHFFSYAKQLLGSKLGHITFSVNQFVKEHKHQEDEVKAMIEFIKKNVSNPNFLVYKVLIGKLELLQRDLLIHAFVEDYALVPKIKTLEASRNQ